MHRTALLFAALLLFGSSAAGRDVFVDNLAGDDRNDGGSPQAIPGGSGPCRSIARALRSARQGDRIVIANTGEPYRESITLQGGRHSGTSFRPFEIVGNGVVLDGSQPVPQDEWEHVAGDVFRYRPPRLAYQQLFLDDRPALRKPVTEDFQMPKLEPREWCQFDLAIHFRAEQFKIPQNYQLSYAALPVGITLYEVRHVVIRDLTVQGYQLDGVNAHDSAFDVSIGELIARGNGRSGVSVGGASRVRLEACLVGNNGAAQLRSEGFSHTHVLNSDLLENTAPAIVQEGGEVTVEDNRPPEAATP
jgi:hypothetical protein